jgi:hypothetical protein
MGGNEKARNRRKALRGMGLRPLQIWVPDTRLPGFAAECRRQSIAMAQADASDIELVGFLDAALDPLELVQPFNFGRTT